MRGQPYNRAPRCTVTAVLPLPQPPKAPVNLDEALRASCEGVAGITPEVFRSRLSPEDLEDIKAGDIPVKTVQCRWHCQALAGLA